MTTVISRLYNDSRTANAVVKSLQDVGFLDDMIDVMSAAHDGEHLAARMTEALVSRKTAETYLSEMSGDVTLLVVRAPFTPFGAARSAIQTVDAHPSLPSAVTDNNMLIRDVPVNRYNLSVLTNHPLFMTDKKEVGRNDGRISHGFGWRLLKPHKSKRSVKSGGGYMSRMFWPMPLTSKKKDKLSVYRGGKKFLTS
jgi:hypothetical protein